MKRRLWMSVLALGLSGAALAAAPARSELLRLGPYLQQVTTRSAVVVWETDEPRTGQVHYGPTEELQLRSATTPRGTHHEVELDGLAPGQRYAYAVFVDGTRRSQIHWLRTDAGPAAPFRFVLYGDNRSGHEAHLRVVTAILAEPDLAFVLNTGDMVLYPELEGDWRRFFAIEHQLLAKVPLYAALGNHDQANGRADIYRRLFVNRRGPDHSETCFAFSYGNSLFLVLDPYVETLEPDRCLLDGKPTRGCFSDAQKAFITRTLEAASRGAGYRHRFVVSHHGPHTSMAERAGSSQLRALLPQLAASGVTAVLSGHDHFYERGISAVGIPYLISGGGGASLYRPAAPGTEWADGHRALRSDPSHHYVLVEVDGGAVTVTAKRPDGSVIERALLVGGDGGAAPGPRVLDQSRAKRL